LFITALFSLADDARVFFASSGHDVKGISEAEAAPQGAPSNCARKDNPVYSQLIEKGKGENTA
jgi:hypothetical protein